MGSKLLIFILAVLTVGLIGLGLFIGYSQVFSMAAPAQGRTQASTQARTSATDAKPAVG